MPEEDYRYFQCSCGKKTRCLNFQIEHIKSCYGCKTEFDNFVFAKNISEISESEFYSNNAKRYVK